MEYTLGLAIEDYIPVILSSAGLLLLAQMINRLDKNAGKMAYLGFVLITLGGVFKATWKFTIALTGKDIVWMDNGLFVFLGPGFALMAWALWSAQRVLAKEPVPKNVWLRPLAVIILFGVGAVSSYFVQGGRTWVFIMLGLTTFSNLAVGILLIRQARQNGLNLVAGLFLFNLVAIFTLSGMARIDPQTIPLQWTEQIINTFSQGSFFYASWCIFKLVEAQFQKHPDSNIQPLAASG
jgi:hypothetical protein